MQILPSSGRILAIITLCLPLLTSFRISSASTPVLELYGTFHSMGVNVEINPADDLNGNATAQVVYWIYGSDRRLTGHPLSRVLPGRFSGSIFWLTPGTRYLVEVTFSDPDNGPLNHAMIRGDAQTRAEIAVAQAVHSYYASPSGTGTECLLSSPCAVAQAIALAQAGDEVVLRGGVYYQGGFDLPHSGVAGAPIVIRSHNGEKAIFDGSDPATFNWTHEGDGIYSTVVRAENPQVVLASGERLFPHRTLADLRGLIYGISGMLVNGTSLRVHLTGNVNPATIPMVISRHNYAFYSEQNFIYFIGLTFRYYGCNEWPKTIYFLDSSDNLVRDCIFANNDVGVGLKYNSHRNVIEDCEFYDSIYGWSWYGVKSNGSFGVEDGGICVYEPFIGRGTVIRRNTFHDDFDGLHISPEDGTTSSETDFYENRVYRMVDDGMEVDGYAANVRLWRNTFHDCLMGISLAPCYVGPVYAIRNLIYRIGATPLSEPDGSVFKFNSGYDPSGPMFLYHNTGIAATEDRNSLTLWEPGDWKMVFSRNNIWSATAYVLANYNTRQPLDMDYDNLYTSRTGELVWWEGLGDDGHLRTLAEFQSATGLERHGINALPGFKNPGAGDFSLSQDSALINKGIYIPGINEGYSGAAPDMGAFEAAASVAKDDLIGSWRDQGVYNRNSDSGQWTYVTTPALILASGDVDGDGIDDMIGVWESGTWCWQSASATWKLMASPAASLSAGDLNRDGKAEILGIWGSEIYVRDSKDGSWRNLGQGASRVAVGDMDGDGAQDVIGVWPSGLWVQYSSTGQWALLSSPADSIAAGDLYGDGKADLIGSWSGQGTFVRDSAGGSWTLVSAAPATQLASGDLDGDGKDDLIGVWPSGTWALYSGTRAWKLLASPAACISAGRLRTPLP